MGKYILQKLNKKVLKQPKKGFTNVIKVKNWLSEKNTLIYFPPHYLINMWKTVMICGD